ncbi:MAG: AraC family transcriptional regulator [Burkholderiales bacterium]|nr:AraC family transcriptional regulator [Burkholderiales bacterium]
MSRLSVDALSLSPGEGLRRIAFDRHKYGMPLLVDACSVASIPGFITGPLPHRLGFYEIAFVTAGRGRLELDGAAAEVAPGTVLVTRPHETRRWRLERAHLQGWLAFFEADFLDAFFADPCFTGRMAALSRPPADRAIALPRRRFDALLELVGTMAAELGAPRSDSSHLLRADMYRLLTLLQRASPAPAERGAAEPASLATRFAEQLAADARMGDGVAGHAERLGTSARALNRSLRIAFGRSAGELIHAHVLLAAQRLLLQTDLSAAAIAERLNFSDAAYFSRFFRRRTGLPPGGFRARHKSASAGADVHCEAAIDR